MPVFCIAGRKIGGLLVASRALINMRLFRLGDVSRWLAAFAGVVALMVMSAWPLGANAATGLANLPAVLPAMPCASVASLDLSGVTDGTVTITSATVLPAGTVVGFSTLPSTVCDVKGTIGPGASMFELQLPTQGWTQRYLQTGCGGLCGNLSINAPMASTCVPVTNGQIAMSATDMGHEGANDGSWALSPQAKIDFAYRAEHATAQVSKAIINKFYARPARYSYFDGCSDGGREALMEAQRYPDDFDGIAAGAPANDLIVQNTFHHGWAAAVNIDPATGNYILLADKLPLIHAAVLSACGTQHGVTDGWVDNPEECHFDPAVLLCKKGQAAATCLSPAEANVVRLIHDGATDANGVHLEQPISREWGSELNWTIFIPTTAAGPSGALNFVLPFLQYLDYFNGTNTNATLGNLKFTIENFMKTIPTSSYLAATDPDLRPFESRGGKLILWHGLADQHITPLGTIQYYYRMQDVMGANQVDQFARLYLFPGVAHCGQGDGPNTFDIVSEVMAWAETGSKPGKIIASVVDSTGQITVTRPVFPFPAVARYTGSGSTSDAANFVAYTPTGNSRSNVNWFGNWLYSPGYESGCHAQATGLDCKGGNDWSSYRMFP